MWSSDTEILINKIQFLTMRIGGPIVSCHMEEIMKLVFVLNLYRHLSLSHNLLTELAMFNRLSFESVILYWILLNIPLVQNRAKISIRFEL